MADAVARMMSKTTYLWALPERRLVYVSPNTDIIGVPAGELQQITDLGTLVTENQTLKAVADELKSEFSSLDKGWVDEVVIYLNFHIGHGSKGRLINHKITPIAIDATGEPQLLFGIVSPSVHRDERYIFYKVETHNIFRHYNFSTGHFENTLRIHISPHEREMLTLSAAGYRIDDVATRMCRSRDAVLYYRKEIYRKLGVTNIVEAIAHAEHYGII